MVQGPRHCRTASSPGQSPRFDEGLGVPKQSPRTAYSESPVVGQGQTDWGQRTTKSAEEESPRAGTLGRNGTPTTGRGAVPPIASPSQFMPAAVRSLGRRSHVLSCATCLLPVQPHSDALAVIRGARISCFPVLFAGLRGPSRLVLRRREVRS